jgi:hypothetical protein
VRHFGTQKAIYRLKIRLPATIYTRVAEKAMGIYGYVGTCPRPAAGVFRQLLDPQSDRIPFPKRSLLYTARPHVLILRMISSPLSVGDWELFFKDVADRLNVLASQHWPLEPDGSGSDAYVSMHRLFKAFPLAVDVLLLDTAGIQNNIKEGNIAALIRYDFSRLNTLSVKVHGIIPLADLNSHADLVKSLANVEDESLESLRELRLRSTQFFPYYVDIAPYDPRLNPSRYTVDLLTFFDPHGEFWELFSVQPDFNAKCDLDPDLVLNEGELLKIDPTNGGFFSRDKIESIREIQEGIAHIQLIPKVPENVMRVFHWAKRLYVFGLFEYGFFTVSCHYAYLAVESAVYNRWNAALPMPTVLQCGIDSMTVPTPGRGNISLICKTKGWKERQVKVNGRPYPWKVELAIEQLEDDGVITMWHQKRLRDVWMKLRNIHSHLEFASITGPRAGTLERAAEVINILFDS